MLTEYDKKYLVIFIIAEIVAFFVSRIGIELIKLIPETAGLIYKIMIELKPFIVPGCLILTALSVMKKCSDNRSAGGSE